MTPETYHMNPRRSGEKKEQRRHTGLGPAPREMCFSCFRAQTSCLCKRIQPFSTNAHFVILMHPKEARRGRNGTGRLARLCLENARIEVGIDFTQHPAVNGLLHDPRYHPLLLYPGAHAITVSAREFPLVLREGRKPLFFIPDGTWSLAKKIITRSKNLHALPRIALAPGVPSRFIIKRQPTASSLSTVETLHALLTLLEKNNLETLQGRHRILLQVCDALVDYQLGCVTRNRVPGLRRSPFSAPENLLPTLK